MANTIIALYKDIHRNSVILHSRETHIQMPTLIQHSTETHIHIPTTYCTLQKQTFNCPLLSCTLLKPIFTNKQTDIVPSRETQTHMRTAIIALYRNTYLHTHTYHILQKHIFQCPLSYFMYRNTHSNAQCCLDSKGTHIHMHTVITALYRNTHSNNHFYPKN